MAVSSITLKLTPSEYSTLKLELYEQKRAVEGQYETARRNHWHTNSDGRSLAKRLDALAELLDNV